MHTPFAARFLWSSARIILGLAGAVLVTAADWPQFRGLTGVGLSSEKNLPLKWGGKEKENVLWQTPLIGQGHASPIVSGDAVFVCTVSWPTNSSQREKVMPDHFVTHYRAILTLMKSPLILIYQSQIFARRLPCHSLA